MKKKLSRILSVALAVLMLVSVIPFSVSAATVMASGECGENLTWTLDSEGTLIFSGTGYLGRSSKSEIEEGSASEASYLNYKNDIKKIIVNEGITKIGPFAFEDCKNLSEIILPESLEYLGELIFRRTSLKTLHIPANVQRIGGPVVENGVFEGYTVDDNNQYFSTDENGNLFNKDKTALLHVPFDPALKEFTVPDSVTTIGYGAFGYNIYIEKINIPETVTVIEEGAFGFTFSLKELNLPKHLEKLGWCENSTSYGISDYGIEKFGAYLGYYNKLTIPEVDSFICNAARPEDSEHDHYETIKHYGLTEITVYDKNVDCSEWRIGLDTGKYTPESLQLFRNAVLQVNIPVYASILFGWEYNFDPDDTVNADDFVVKDADPDFVINGKGYYKIPGFTVRCYPGSTAEEYAKKYDFNIKYICEEHTEEIIPAVLPTCTETGLTEGKKCSVCDEILVVQKTVEEKGHDYKTTVTAPTCTEKGFTTYACDCGDSYVGDYTKATGHDYKSEVTEEPDCKENGTKVYYCDCGDSYTEKIPATGHKDNDNNNSCDNCGVGVCDHMCHKDGILGFFWKIIRIFQKLFGMNPICECGAAHY
ncbi:MAG: leucine-rich repeat domain-containing protein [Ruminococcaceae bacterium]|nr:leucine-rich repeat domain-containing protein [Oscillospiraceae bacterium]